MKNEFGRYVVFFFLIFGCFGVFGQSLPTLEYENKGGGKVEFTVNNLVRLPDDLDKFNASAYYEALIMYGDGNFEKVGLVKNGDTYTYSYRDLENNYPAAMMLTARKNGGEEPPDPTEMLIIPNNTSVTDSSSVNVYSDNTTPSVPMISNTIVSGLPRVPMIPESGRGKLAMGLSHYFEGGNIYFLEEKTVHAIPIAYRPSGEGVLLFFYNNNDEGFEYYDEVSMRGLTPNNDNTGTLLSKYYQLNQSENIYEVMEAIEEFPVPGSSDTNYGGINLNNVSGYDKLVAHSVTANNASLVRTEVLHPNGSPSNEGELRLFHFIKAGRFKNKSENAKFLAVLYEKVSVNSDGLFALNELVGVDDSTGNGPFPPTIEVENGGVSSVFGFSNYATIEARKGEPDDPGGLIIEDVSRLDQEDYEVTFKLTFCNSENAVDSAVGANIFLESYPVDIAPTTEPFLRDIKIISSCVDSWDANMDLTCAKIADSACEIQNSLNILHHDAVTCYDFNPGKLAPGACGFIRFSAMMKPTEVGRLTNESVMRYCVKFHDGMEVGEFCRPNVIIQDTVCYIDTTSVNYDPNTPIIICESNPVLEGVVPVSICSCGCYHSAWIWAGILALLFVLSCGFFLFKSRKRKKYRHQQKAWQT